MLFWSDVCWYRLVCWVQAVTVPTLSEKWKHIRKARVYGSFSNEPFEKWPVMSFGICISIYACIPALFNFGLKQTKHISAARFVGFLRFVHGIFTQDLHRFNFNMNLYKILRNLRFSIGGGDEKSGKTSRSSWIFSVCIVCQFKGINANNATHCVKLGQKNEKNPNTFVT